MAHFDALGITAEDLAASLGFYRLCGLDIPETDEGHVEVELAGGFRLMFDSKAVIESFSTYEPATGGRHIGLAFRCDTPADVDATHAALVAAGHRSKEEPFDAFWGQRYATVLDPDDNPIDFYCTQ
jgi:uncharacterized glyoxalase superfamily protein PhnB